MANLTTSSPRSVTVTKHSSERNKFLVIAAGPLLLLVLAMTGLRFLNTTEEPSLPDRPLRLRPAPGVVRPPLPPLDAAAQKEIKQIVLGQISAFQADDYAKAITFSTPDYQQQLNPTAFRLLILRNYAELARAKSVKIHQLQNQGPTATVLLSTEDTNGRQQGFLYQVEKVEAKWRVTGCARMPMLPLSRMAGMAQPTTEVRKLRPTRD